MAAPPFGDRSHKNWTTTKSFSLFRIHRSNKATAAQAFNHNRIRLKQADFLFSARAVFGAITQAIMMMPAIQLRRAQVFHTIFASYFGPRRSRARLMPDDTELTINPDESSENEENHVKRARPNPMDELIVACMVEFQQVLNPGTDPAVVYSTILSVRRLIVKIKPEDARYIQKFLTFGLLPCVEQTLSAWGAFDIGDYSGLASKIQMESLSILAELSSRDGLSDAIVHSGAVTPIRMICFANKRHRLVRENTIWLLANLYGDHAEFRHQVSKEHVLLQAVVDNMEDASRSRSLTMQFACGFAISNLVRNSSQSLSPGTGNAVDVHTKVVMGFVPCVVRQLHDMIVRRNLAPELVLDLAGALKYIVHYSREAREAVFCASAQLVDTLFVALDRYSQRTNGSLVTVVVLHALVALAAGTKAQADAVVKTAILPRAYALLDDGNHLEQQATLLFFANVAARGIPTHIEWMLREHKLLTRVKRLAVGSENHTKVKQEALWIFAHIVNNSKNQGEEAHPSSDYRAKATRYQCVKAFCQYLERGPKAVDMQLTVAILDALDLLMGDTPTSCSRWSNTIKAYNGHVYIQPFLDHASPTVSQAASRVVDKMDLGDSDESPEPSQAGAATSSSSTAVVSDDDEENDGPESSSNLLRRPPPMEAAFS